MTVEDRLRDALQEADHIEPRFDLFTRLTSSLEEGQARRRRLTKTLGAITFFLAVLAAYSIWAFGPAAGVVEGWKVVLPQVAISAVLIVALGPNIRRFGVGFVDEVFYLTPETGRKFLAVLDIAYYLTFSGLVLVDADVWQLTVEGPAVQLVEASVRRVAFLLLTMGVLHAINIACLPVLGLIYNSVVRSHLRSTGVAPSEMSSSRTADRNARAFAIAAVVALVALLAGLLIGPLAGFMVVLLEG